MADPAAPALHVAGRRVGAGAPVYVIAELSANHLGDLARAHALVDAAADAGADAVKLQTYTADAMTLDSDASAFVIGPGSPWTGRRLHDLYAEAATPWEWHAELMEHARERGLHCFSSPFDSAAVELLESLDVPAYKVASFELVDLGLVATVAATGKPLIMSTGMATVAEIDAAVRTASAAGAREVALLRCTSAYPAPVTEMDLRTIPDLAARWPVVVGLSDHTLSTTAAVVATALGAAIVEKHLTLSRAEPGPDSAFSLEPAELASLVRGVRDAEAALGQVRYGPAAHEVPSLQFRRSLFVVADVATGEPLTDRNVRSLRPGVGLPPAELPRVLGRRAARPIPAGTPLAWDLVS